MTNEQQGITPEMQQQGDQLLNQLKQQGMTPEQKVREMLQNGQITPQQFMQLRIMANKITGMKM